MMNSTTMLPLETLTTSMQSDGSPRARDTLLAKRARKPLMSLAMLAKSFPRRTSQRCAGAVELELSWFPAAAWASNLTLLPDRLMPDSSSSIFLSHLRWLRSVSLDCGATGRPLAAWPGALLRWASGLAGVAPPRTFAEAQPSGGGESAPGGGGPANGSASYAAAMVGSIPSSSFWPTMRALCQALSLPSDATLTAYSGTKLAYSCLNFGATSFGLTTAPVHLARTVKTITQSCASSAPVQRPVWVLSNNDTRNRPFSSNRAELKMQTTVRSSRESMSSFCWLNTSHMKSRWNSGRHSISCSSSKLTKPLPSSICRNFRVTAQQSWLR
mmetsp:Transcript_143196/g.399158  ORF Transcript_143196/g.399158 Transcript_143196/m.399158 type:complete len:328 (+) Transcript_143196:603-1586(+)